MAAVVLLSGGLDSAVAAFMARQEIPLRLALTCDYGQRAAAREIEASGRLAALLGIPQQVVPLPWVQTLAAGALVGDHQPLPHPEAHELQGPAAEASAQAVWVPNRNGVLLNVAALYAEALGCDQVVCGFNAEEAQTFPDNSPAFVEAINATWRLSTRNQVRLLAPTQALDKAEIVRQGRELGVPLDWLWSCYEGGIVPCRRCESCRRLQRALEANDSR